MANISLAHSALSEKVSNYIAQVNAELKHYTHKLESHPIAKLCAKQQIPRQILNEFAKIQYVDSAFWVPMLSLIKGAVKSERLLKAVKENIICETGINATPHITLCKRYIESLGIMPSYGDYQNFSKHSIAPIELTLAIQDLGDPTIAGWLLAEEALVPVLFRIFRPAYALIKEADMGYLDEHISVDSDEHAVWMLEAVQELCVDSDSFEQVMAGIDLGARKTLCIPDALYSETMRLLQHNR